MKEVCTCVLVHIVIESKKSFVSGGKSDCRAFCYLYTKKVRFFRFLLNSVQWYKNVQKIYIKWGLYEQVRTS